MLKKKNLKADLDDEEIEKVAIEKVAKEKVKKEGWWSYDHPAVGKSQG